MENNTNNVNDKGKIMVLVSLIIAVSILLVAFIFVTVIDLTHKDAQSRISTTTRRTISTKTTDEIDDFVTEPITEVPITTSSEKPVTTEPKTTTTRKVVESVVTTSTTNNSSGGTVIPSHSYDIAYDSTTYPDALDTWEWEIVNLINQERKNNGLSELSVAKELRNKSEEAAYMYYASNKVADNLKSYLNGYAYLYGHSNLNIDARTIYESALNSTKITTNPDIKYVGVGVLVKSEGLDTYYYVLTYE